MLTCGAQTSILSPSFTFLLVGGGVRVVGRDHGGLGLHRIRGAVLLMVVSHHCVHLDQDGCGFLEHLLPACRLWPLPCAELPRIAAERAREGICRGDLWAARRQEQIEGGGVVVLGGAWWTSSESGSQ